MTMTLDTVTDEQKTMFAERVAKHDSETPGYGEQWQAWRETLIAAGGQEACPPLSPEEDLPLLLTRSQYWPGKGARKVKGAPSQCHWNVATLYDDAAIDSIVTGYALSDDGLWRQHSWGLKDGRIVETTTRRDAYVGYVLTEDECDDFIYWNA